MMLSFASKNICFAQRALGPLPTLPQPGLYTACMEFVSAWQDCQLVLIHKWLEAYTACVAVVVVLHASY